MACCERVRGVLTGACMFDQILTVAVVLLPTIFAVVIELVSEDIKKSGFWRVGVLVFGVVLSILTFYQIHRADGIAAKDREDAIEKTSQSVSEKVVPKVAAETSANVTEALNQQYGSVISGLYRELAEQSDLTGEICTKWNERESTWRKSGACRSRGTSQSRS
jgi:predicted transcriptional regulator